jgi:hypothetical protein
MTQGPADGRSGAARTDGSFSRREQRVSLILRTSQAIHQAHATVQDAVKTRGIAGDGLMTAMETRALVEAELEAMQALESDVRRFADLLRTQGTPPEVAVRRLKATVDPVVYAAREPDAPGVEWRRAVAGDVMRWFVEAYYAA